MIYNTLAFGLTIVGMVSGEYSVKVLSRSTDPVLSFVGKNSVYQQIFNPTWVEETLFAKRGIIARTQNCKEGPKDITASDQCTWCGGAQDKASILTYSELLPDGTFKPVDESSVVFGPSDPTDSWGTEDPRLKYNVHDKQYYMFYTAYNGSAIFLNLATTQDPTSSKGWKKHGAVFPSEPGSKSGALLIRESGPHYLLWGDHEIKIAKSDDPAVWPDVGVPLLQTRADKFDSQLVESGPPPMVLDNGDLIFFYNSAEVGWPQNLNTAYHVGWAILDGKDPTIVKARSDVPLMGPEQAWEKGEAPYACNAPNVVFLEAAYELGGDRFQVYFGGADNTIGGAVIEVKY